MKKYLIVFKEYFIWFFFLIKSINLFGKKVFYIFDVPMNANLGDQAIIESEKKILYDNFKRIKIVEVSSYILDKPELLFKLKKIIKKQDSILLQGGGSLDDRAWKVVDRFINIINMFPNHRIIIFPQTISFSNSHFSKNKLSHLQRSVLSHSNIIIFAREKTSYDFMSKKFPGAEIILVPDIVLYNNIIVGKKNRKNRILCFFRNDAEKTLNEKDFNYIKSVLANNFANYNICYSDTVLKKNGNIKKVYWFNRRLKIKKIFHDIQTSKLIITDRLHAMIFGFINHTPVILLPSLSPKIKGVYQWLNSFPQIVFLDDLNKLDETINQLLKQDYNKYTQSLQKYFVPLIDKLKDETYEFEK